MTAFTNSKTEYNLEQFAGLRARLSGESRVIVPGDDVYDMARRGWNLAVDQYPAMIVVVKTAQDVSEAVRFAQSQGLKIAITATGHGVIRKADNSLLIDTSKMAGVSMNAAARTAWVGAGTKWGAVLEAAQAVGLAPLLGSSPGVGAIGYTLGGGMGWLVRKYGLSADSVNYFD
ncbi:MAG: FAD-dependent oxidoreductase, partial [Anaerolineaceae bacterium]|nr:FAD-dependent oxidoreductase [Anaerolineaceae bacterium]